LVIHKHHKLWTILSLRRFRHRQFQGWRRHGVSRAASRQDPGREKGVLCA